MASSRLPVVMYTTSVPTTAKVKTDIQRIKRILDAKWWLQYEEVDLSMHPERREEMLAGSGSLKILPQLHANGQLLGDGDTIQELEDFGELDAKLQAAQQQ